MNDSLQPDSLLEKESPVIRRDDPVCLMLLFENNFGGAVPSASIRNCKRELVGKGTIKANYRVVKLVDEKNMWGVTF